MAKGLTTVASILLFWAGMIFLNPQEELMKQHQQLHIEQGDPDTVNKYLILTTEIQLIQALGYIVIAYSIILSVYLAHALSEGKKSISYLFAISLKSLL